MTSPNIHDVTAAVVAEGARTFKAVYSRLKRRGDVVVNVPELRQAISTLRQEGRVAVAGGLLVVGAGTRMSGNGSPAPMAPLRPRTMPPRRPGSDHRHIPSVLGAQLCAPDHLMVASHAMPASDDLPAGFDDE